MEEENFLYLSMRENYRTAVFIEEEIINGPEQDKNPLGMGGPPAMQFGSYNVNEISDEIELANWYRSERFPRLPVTRGMIRGRKLLSIAGWAKHGVLWEFIEMDEKNIVLNIALLKQIEEKIGAVDTFLNMSHMHQAVLTRKTCLA